MKSPTEGEHQLRHAQRLAMLGTLTCGLGHDMRNLLMPALLRLDVLSAAAEADSQMRQDLSNIRHSLEGLQLLAEGLRLLSADPFRRQSDRQTTRLTHWWRDFQGIAGDALPPNTAVSVEFDGDLPDAAIPPGVLSHMVLTGLLLTRRSLSRRERPQMSIAIRSSGDALVVALLSSGDDTRRNNPRSPPDVEQLDPLEHPEVTTATIADARALLQHYKGDLQVQQLGDGEIAVLIQLRSVSARLPLSYVRTAVTYIADARQSALVMRFLLGRGIQISTGTDISTTDVVICDRDSLPMVLEEFSPPGARRPRIIALGEQDALDERNVQWVNLNRPGQLEDVLSPGGDLSTSGLQ